MLGLFIYWVRGQDGFYAVRRIGCIAIIACGVISLGFFLHSKFEFGTTSANTPNPTANPTTYAILEYTLPSGKVGNLIAWSDGTSMQLPEDFQNLPEFSPDGLLEKALQAMPLSERVVLPQPDPFPDSLFDPGKTEQLPIAAGGVRSGNLTGVYTNAVLPLFVSVGVEILGALVMFTVIENVIKQINGEAS
tara:strand:- start:3126 stop:3698 length:573 start_codon:yes stop_codon:yes gene_type:complete